MRPFPAPSSAPHLGQDQRGAIGLGRLRDSVPASSVCVARLAPQKQVPAEPGEGAWRGGPRHAPSSRQTYLPLACSERRVTPTS